MLYCIVLGAMLYACSEFELMTSSLTLSAALLLGTICSAVDPVAVSTFCCLLCVYIYVRNVCLMNISFIEIAMNSIVKQPCINIYLKKHWKCIAVGETMRCLG